MINSIYESPKFNINNYIPFSKPAVEFGDSATRLIRGFFILGIAMPRRKTQEEFISQATEIHNDKYNYSLVMYKNSYTKIKIICENHGEFEQLPNHHLNGHGCRKCYFETVGPPKRNSISKINKKLHKLYGNKYTYNLDGYKNLTIKMKCLCQKHGEFYQSVGKLFSGHACPKCGIEQRSNKTKKTKEQFILDSIIVHGDKYDYSESLYINTKEKVKIICKKHGPFFQNAGNHLSGYGCNKCGNILLGQNGRIGNKKFIERASVLHNFKYDYSLVEYKTFNEKVIIICPIHGEFKQKPDYHLRGSGCRYCKNSKGENKTREILIKNNIEFIEQKSFKGLRNNKPLRFDFYLPKYNLCIEYDGEQHFRPVKLWGGEKNFRKTIHNDTIKTDFCKNNKINLLRIAYNENIEQKLQEAGIV